jgi:enoyl-CoA hydratase
MAGERAGFTVASLVGLACRDRLRSHEGARGERLGYDTCGVVVGHDRGASQIVSRAMPAQHVRSELRADGVAVLRLDRPPVNALSRAVLGELGDVARALGGRPGLKAVVVTGGPRALAAGADIDELSTTDPALVTAAFRDAFDAVAAIPRPVIAAIGGIALGGGLELAMACDLRVAATSARLGQPEVLLGIIPGAGGTQRLPRLVGPARAKELVWTGRHLRAEEALAIGLVDRVVPDEDLETEALAWAGSLATGAVVAMGLAKTAIDRGLDGPLQRGLDVERDAFTAAFRTEDATEGIRSFLEHGPGRAAFRGT